MVSAWNRIAASAKIVEYTPQAPSQGSVRSSYLNPSTSRPFTKVSAHSLRLSISASISPISSSESTERSVSSISSARLPSKDISEGPEPGTRVISTLPSSSVTMSGLTISISNPPSGSASSSGNSSSILWGAAYSPFSIAIKSIPNNIHQYGA